MPSADPSHETTTDDADKLTHLPYRFRNHPLLILFNLCLALGTFLLDVFIDTDIAIGMLYGAPVAWMALWSSKHDTPLR